MKWLLKWGWMWIYLVLISGAVLFITLGDHEPIEDNSPEKITLTFRHFWIKEHDRPLLAIFEEIVDKYQIAHPNIKVNFEGLDQTIHREQKLKSEMVTGTPPDMFVLFGGAEIEPYVRSNRLVDLTDFVRENGLTNQFKDLHLWTFDNHIYGLPIEGNAEPLYYNKTIFNKLGLGAPTTLQELDDVVLGLKAGGYIPFALGNEDRWPAGIFAHYLMDRYAGSELIQKLITGEDQASFQNEAYLKAFEHLDQWIKEGAFSSKSNDLSTENAVSLFASGKAAMYLNGNWDINLFSGSAAPADFQNEVGVIPFPALKQGEEPSIAGGYTIGIGLSSELNGAKREAALDLMKAFYTQEVQTRIVYEGLRIPSIRIAFDPEKTGPVFAQVMEMMEVNRKSFVPYDNVLSPEVKKMFLSVIEKMINEEMSADHALKLVQASSMEYWNLIQNSSVQ
ncbi:raffinose/stachyose/melibiose transport system substrate-binding protein [Paenibacillus sp. PastF-3]|uniref:ABC transporter substrate-binding protein n=1 Tax=Paenibacillus sp. PastF-3 TaxID=2940626 RepID=UPI002475B3AA|nr:extracellular solute-binding protein [Paenibacillus sp. PastF-3]MDH6368302.1 raffinose/stachyose/melibiose transport system substrate-binding protein [Paenibacillus sp. PastF-3]